MAVFTAYFDASGHPAAADKKAAMYVCGFVSTVEKWKRLETAWPELLEQYTIPSPLHMTDFMARKARFKDWNGSDAERDAFRFAAVKLLERTTNKPFAVGVVIADMQRAFREFDVPSNIPREPFPWCALMACEQVFKWGRSRFNAGKFKESDELEIVFEDDDHDKGKFKAALWERHHCEVAFRTNQDKAFIPFAVCDFLAWEARRWFTARERGLALREQAKWTVSPDRKIELNRKAASLLRAGLVMQEIARLLPPHSLKLSNWGTFDSEFTRLGYAKRAR